MKYREVEKKILGTGRKEKSRIGQSYAEVKKVK